MTKYEIIDRVSRFVKRFGMIMDPETMNKAKAEAGEYGFRFISKDHYAVRHGHKMYVIIERNGEIGCSCDAMTFNRMDGSCCKHIIEFTRLMSPPSMKIDDLDEAHLRNVCGWTGKELHPEIELGEPGAVIQEDTTTTPKDSIPPDPDLDLGVDDPLPQTPDPEARSNERPVQEETKMEEKTAWDQAAWDNATQGSFVTYDEAGVAMVLFTANDFEIGTKPDKWGRPAYEFAVIQHHKAVVLSVGSVRLMNALKTILPLEGKTVKILRTGEGTGTKYDVEVVA